MIVTTETKIILHFVISGPRNYIFHTRNYWYLKKKNSIPGNADAAEVDDDSPKMRLGYIWLNPCGNCKGGSSSTSSFAASSNQSMTLLG